MVFSLIFFFFLSLIVIAGSYMLLKTKTLEFSERINSTLLILFIFAVIAVLNEYKQPPDLTSILSTHQNGSAASNDFIWEILHEEELNSLEKKFYAPFHNQFKNSYKLPILKDSKSFLTKALGLTDEKFKGNKEFFMWVNSDANIGVSFALREFSRQIQNEFQEFPILYLNLKKMHQFFLGDIHFPLRVSSTEIVYKVLENFNKKGIMPIIIIDCIEKSFKIKKKGSSIRKKQLDSSYLDIHNLLKEKGETESIIFEKLKDIFHKFNVKIIVINYDKNQKIKKLPHFIEEKIVTNEDRDWEQYLVNVLNDFIIEKEKKFNHQSTSNLKEMIDFDFKIIKEFFHNIKSYKSPEGCFVILLKYLNNIKTLGIIISRKTKF